VGGNEARVPETWTAAPAGWRGVGVHSVCLCVPKKWYLSNHTCVCIKLFKKALYLIKKLTQYQPKRKWDEYIVLGFKKK
jgi:hypothetical protein